MTMVMDDVVGRESRHVLQTYKRNPVTLVRGQGVRLYDVDGREYLDLLSGIGVAALGHAHPGLARAIAEQAQTLIHTSNLFYHPLQGQLAERLAVLSGLPRAFFCNSGTEAVEACLKFARRYWHTKGTPRSEFIALDESFHGRTFGSLSVTSDEHYRKPFEPLLPKVTFMKVACSGLSASGENSTRDAPGNARRAVTAMLTKTDPLLKAVARHHRTGGEHLGFGCLHAAPVAVNRIEDQAFGARSG